MESVAVPAVADVDVADAVHEFAAPFVAAVAVDAAVAVAAVVAVAVVSSAVCALAAYALSEVARAESDHVEGVALAVGALLVLFLGRSSFGLRHPAASVYLSLSFCPAPAHVLYSSP